MTRYQNMRVNLAEVVRAEFENKKQLTLEDLYKLLSQNSDINIEPSKLKHRIRSTIYSLQQSKKIKRVGGAIYEKI